jgi:hypothetical protein
MLLKKYMTAELRNSRKEAAWDHLRKNAAEITLEASLGDAESNVRSDAEEGASELLHCSALEVCTHS